MAQSLGKSPAWLDTTGMRRELHGTTGRESGSILIESAMVISLFLFILVGAVDVARYFGNHLAASRIAYEGARFGSALAGLPTVTNGGDGNETASGAWQGQVKERMQRLCDELSISAIELEVSYNSSTNTVVTNVELPFRSLLLSGFAGNISKARMTAPYLYINY